MTIRFDCFDDALTRTPYNISMNLKKNKEDSVSRSEYV